MRGDVHRLRRPKGVLGHEQDGRRYAVVVQATSLLYLSRWMVVPTSASGRAVRGPLRPVVDWGAGESVVLCDGMLSVDPQIRLGEWVGTLTWSDLQDVDQGIAALLDLV